MKIGMLADIYKPHISGVTNYISLNKKHLEKKGHQVYIFTFSSNEEYHDDESNIIRSPGLPLAETGFHLNFSYSRPVQKLLHTMDIVHVHHPFVSGSLAIRYCRPRNIPIVFTNHTRYDLYLGAYFPILPDSIGETAMRAYLPTFCRACDLVIAPSPGMARVLERFGVDAQMEVVPNGVELEPFRTHVHPVNRGELEINPNDVVLIFVGRLGPEKNLPFLLRSFSGAAQAFDHIHLLIVGDGPERDNLQDQAKNSPVASRIHFAGLVPYEELPRYLTMADAFVTASVTEVHPLSVIEAMASGLPVLGINSPGVGDTIEDNVTGFLSSEEDLAEFTAKLIRLATEHENRRAMGMQARKAVEKYNIEHTTKIMLNQYEQLLLLSRERKRGLRYRITHFLDHWS